MLIDTHVHLNADVLYNDLDNVIQRALEQGVSEMIVVGFDTVTNKRAIEIAEAYPFIYATVGIHPTEAAHARKEDFDLLEEQLKHGKVIGVGECGMDLYWDKDHLKEQIDVFQAQIKLSLQYDKPLIIHMRDASEVTLQVLREFKGLKGIMHCYSGSAEMVPLFTKLGLHISLGGPVTFKNGHKPKEVAKIVESDYLLIETDSPYLSPHPFRGKTNEPSRVRLVAEEIARLRNVSLEEIADLTRNNAHNLFNLKEE